MNNTPIIWSKSKLNTIINCPLAYKFRYIDRKQQDVVEALNKGVILHEIFDKFYIYNKDLNKTIHELRINPDFVVKYNQHINNFIDFNTKLKLEPIHREQKYNVDNITGIIDRVDIINDKYAIIDYKTSTGDNIDDYKKELLLYAYLIQKVHKINIQIIGIFFTNNNNFITEDITQDDINNNINDINNDIENCEYIINNKTFIKTPGTHCLWCGFKKYCQNTK